MWYSPGWGILLVARRMHNRHQYQVYIEGIRPKGLFLPYLSMAGRALLAGYRRYEEFMPCSWLCNLFHNVNAAFDFVFLQSTNSTSFMCIVYLRVFWLAQGGSANDRWSHHWNTVKPVCSDHLYNKLYHLWFIQLCVFMMIEGTNLLVLTISAFWS